MSTGHVKFFNEPKGFGFIACEDGTEVFVHANDIVGKERVLKAGELVEFDRVPNLKKLDQLSNSFSARNVRRIAAPRVNPHQPY